MTQPIAGTYSTLVTLGSVSYNPTTIAATGLLSDGLLVSYPGLTVVNAGSIAGPDVSGGFGIDLTAGGSVTNQSGGAISGYDGIDGKNAAATVVNAGSIAGSYRGIYLRAGGSVTNQSGGAISGTTFGIYLYAGGSVTNQSGGAISGRDGIDGENAAVTVVNTGSITGSFAGVLLFAAGGSVTNQSGGVISGNDGIVDTAGAVTVVNAGSIAANAGGVALLAGGSVTNKSGGTISGYRAIVGSVAAMTVVNAGSIAGSGFGIYLYAGGSVTNQSGGAISGTTFGIYLYAGGSVTNQSGGVISGRAGIFAAGASTVVNAGSIGGNATSGLGVYLRTGGSLTNQAGGTISGGVDAVKFRAGDTGRLVIDPGAVFVGTVDGGNTIGAAALSTLELASASSAGTLSGLGTQFIDFAQITVDAGAQWTLQTTDTIEAGVTLTNAGTLNGALTLAPGGVLSNASTGTITAPGTAVYGMIGGAATVVNAGVIAGYNGFGGRGINLAAGGSVTNQSGGAISGSDGIYSTNAVTVVNAGSIAAHIGVYLRAGGSVTNQSGGSIATNADGIYANLDAVTVVNAGSITGAREGVGLLAGGSVTNQSGGAISGSDGIFGLAGAVTVVNAGSIAESTHDTLGAGVELFAGGSVTNQSGGTISGYDGILGAGAAVTVVNYGTIAGGTGGYAVKFFAGFANRLVIDPNAVFSGTVTGGNTIGAGQVSTLELASAGSAGTLAGLGTQFIDFAQVTVDAGAQWTLTGANTLAAGYILTDAGTLTNAGTLNGALTLAPGGVLSNASTGTITAPGTAVYGMIGGAATVVNAGVIAGYNGFGGRGINLAAGGSVTNQSGGAISGSDGIYSTNAVTVVNAGSIAAHIGVYLRAGGSVTNQSGGSIATNADGIYANLDAVTVVNAGSITGAREGVGLLAGGSVTNQSGGAISGSDGIFGLAGAVTVVNAGSIAESTHDTLGAGVELFAGGSVTNQSGGTISGYDGILGAGAAVTVVNYGTIAGGTGGYAVKFFAGFANRLVIDPNAVFSGTVTGGNTIGAGQVSTLELASAGSAGTLAGLGTQFIDFAQVTVDAGAQWTLTDANTIAAGSTLTNAGTLIDAGTLTNAGTLNGPLTLAAGGILSNTATGTVTASGGAAVYGTAGGAATVVNAGVIAGYNGFGGRGIELTTGGSVTNQSGGTISGFDGIYGRGTATVVNAGSIAGSSYAVRFAPGVANRLIADPGAVFTGAVYGGGGVLELASAASAGTLSGFGTTITNFASLQFDAGAAWTVSGNGSASGLGTIAITGFGDGDTIDLTGFVAVSETFASNTLVLTDSGGAHETLAIQGDFTTGSFTLTQDGPDGTDVVVCFAAGTQVGTPDGEVPVEQLQIGDRVLTAHNGPRPVTWIGQGKVLATHGRRSAATPVIVRKGALADNVPNRDLHVTKAHSLYIDDVLIPVEFLVNHRTILWDDRAQEVEIYHVELESHDVLIANGAPAESYRDDGNRWLFQNANSGWGQPPKPPYAPVLTGGPVVDAAWRLLLDRAGPSDLPSLTEDPDLHLVIDGVRVNPEYRHGSLHGFRLPCSPKSVVIASRAGAPSELGIARDPRPLGVALRQLAVRQGGKFMLFDADDERLTTGFHAYEADCNLRWTDGYAALPAAAFARFDKGAEVMLHLGGATQYPDDRASTARAAA